MAVRGRGHHEQRLVPVVDMQTLRHRRDAVTLRAERLLDGAHDLQRRQQAKQLVFRQDQQ